MAKPAKRKTGGGKRKKKSSPKRKPNLKDNVLKALTGLTALVILVLALAIVARYYLPPEKPAKPVGKKVIQKPSVQKPSTEAPSTQKPSVVQKPTYEVYQSKDEPPFKPLRLPDIKLPSGKPRVAIIIDDLGLDTAIARKLLDLDTTLTFSLLPFSPHTRYIAGAAHEKGIEVMLHLPMQPKEYPRIDPGPGALFTSMTADTLIAQLNHDLDSVPYIKGVNNHMGSEMTTISTQMYQIFSILKKRELYFVDSRTTAESLCLPSARLLQIPFAQRDVFLDHEQRSDFVRKQLERLVETAKANGHAIGIGHPHAVTYEVLRQALPELKDEVLFVPASEIVHLIGS